jgi:hypothetical protein
LKLGANDVKITWVLYVSNIDHLLARKKEESMLNEPPPRLLLSTPGKHSFSIHSTIDLFSSGG